MGKEGRGKGMKGDGRKERKGELEARVLEMRSRRMRVVACLFGPSRRQQSRARSANETAEITEERPGLGGSQEHASDPDASRSKLFLASSTSPGSPFVAIRFLLH